MQKITKKFTLVSLLFITLVLSPLEAFAALPYLDSFTSILIVKEVGSMSLSSNPNWWLNSGGYLKYTAGHGSTNQGSLGATDPWRILYAQNNGVDTDQGLHPQNIFRLVTRDKRQNSRQEAYFEIKKDNLSSSSNRNQSNGLLLFNRYQDGSNLYYTGVRVDGSVIIKKKKGGTYYTMAEIKGVYPGIYNKETKPNLLPKNKWIGLRSEVINLANGKVEIRLYIDKGWTGIWKLAGKAIDDGKSFGGSALTSPGYGGIRTDFMDVEFENFRFRDIDKFTS